MTQSLKQRILKDRFSLQLFILIELILGIDFLFPNFISVGVLTAMNGFMPISVWSLLFVLSAIVGYFSNGLWQYITFVSLPLILYTMIIIDVVLVYNNFMGLTGITTYMLISFGSALIALKAYKK